MKKFAFTFLFLSILGFAMPGFSDCCKDTCCVDTCCGTCCDSCCDPCSDPCCNEFCIEAEVAYFHPTDSLFRDIYGGGVIYGIQFLYSVTPCWYPWLSVNYFNKSGRSIGEKTKTEIDLVPIGFGIKYMFCPCSCWRPYLGIGPQVNYLHIDNDSRFVIDPVKKWGIGGTFEAGMMYRWCGFFLDVFAKYSYMKFNFCTDPTEGVLRRDADVSNFNFGGGIGYCF